jgi:hypothetical protein
MEAGSYRKGRVGGGKRESIESRMLNVEWSMLNVELKTSFDSYRGI